MQTKTCTDCKKEKEIIFFYKRKDKYDAKCKECKERIRKIRK